MSRPVITAPLDMEVGSAVKLLVERRLGCLPVVDGRALVGIVTRSDVIRALQPEASGVRPGERRIGEVMKRSPHTAAPDDRLLDAVARMEASGVRHLPVVDGDARLVGMLSDRDVRLAIGQAMRPLGPRDAVVRMESTRVGDVMSRRPLAIGEDTSISEAALFLADHRIGALPIVDERLRLRGIVSYVDLLRLYAH
jgi:CBS domain-containing protein